MGPVRSLATTAGAAIAAMTIGTFDCAVFKQGGNQGWDIGIITRPDDWMKRRITIIKLQPGITLIMDPRHRHRLLAGCIAMTAKTQLKFHADLGFFTAIGTDAWNPS